MKIIINTKRQTVDIEDFNDITIKDVEFMNIAFDITIKESLNFSRQSEMDYRKLIFLQNPNKKLINSLK